MAVHLDEVQHPWQGKEGTYAVRLQGGKQFVEVDIPNALLLPENMEVAEAIHMELNKGTQESKVRELLCMLKSAMADSIAKRMAATRA